MFTYFSIPGLLKGDNVLSWDEVDYKDLEGLISAVGQTTEITVLKTGLLFF